MQDMVGLTGRLADRDRPAEPGRGQARAGRPAAAAAGGAVLLLRRVRGRASSASFLLFGIGAGLIVHRVRRTRAVVVPRVPAQEARLRKFENQLPDVLEPAGRFDAGRVLVRAGPRGRRRGGERSRRGVSSSGCSPRAASAVRSRTRSRTPRTACTSVDLLWAVMAIRIQREVGGNLAELLDTVAEHDDAARAPAPRDHVAHRRGPACPPGCSASSRPRSRSSCT